MKKILLMLTLTAVASLAWAQSSPFGTGAGKTGKHAPAALTAHVLKKTYNVTDFSGAVLPALTVVDLDSASTIVCPGTSGTCLIQAEQWVQFLGNGTTDNATEICLLVDGAWVDSFCYFAGELNTGTFASQLSTTRGTVVTAGPHTVQTQVMSMGGGNIGYYNLTYRVYKP